MFEFGQWLAGASFLSSISWAAAVPGLAARTLGDIGVHAVDFTSGNGPPPCALLPEIPDDGQIIGSNSTTLTEIARDLSLPGPSPDNPAGPPSPPPCGYITSWYLYKPSVKSLATTNYQLRENSGAYVIDATMDATMDHILIMIRHGDYGSFKILMSFYFGKNEGWCKITLQRGVWFYVTVVMRQPGVRGVVRLSKVDIIESSSIAAGGSIVEPVGDDADRVDVDR